MCSCFLHALEQYTCVTLILSPSYHSFVPAISVFLLHDTLCRSANPLIHLSPGHVILYIQPCSALMLSSPLRKVTLLFACFDGTWLRLDLSKDQDPFISVPTVPHFAIHSEAKSLVGESTCRARPIILSFSFAHHTSLFVTFLLSRSIIFTQRNELYIIHSIFNYIHTRYTLKFASTRPRIVGS